MNLIISSMLLFIIILIAPRRVEERYFSPEQKNYVWMRDKGKCQICRGRVVPYIGEQRSAEFDHIKPYSKGGRRKGNSY